MLEVKNEQMSMETSQIFVVSDSVTMIPISLTGIEKYKSEKQIHGGIKICFMIVKLKSKI